MTHFWQYEKLKTTVGGIDLPAMVVNMDALDHNIEIFAQAAKKYGKQIRIASKSIRVPELLRYIQQKGGEAFKGLMCFSLPEAAYLAEQGFSDLYVAYPTALASDLKLFYTLTQQGHTVSLAIDSVSHLQLIEQVWQKHGGSIKAGVCIDIDMSWKPFGTHLGVFRSPIRNIQDFEVVLDYLLASPHLSLSGIMGYEAQIAGMGDKNPFSPILNPAKRLIKKYSQKDVVRKRSELHQMLVQKNSIPRFFNGGGTGSINISGQESWLTEIAVGSGFLQSHLFDYYALNQCVPAMAFALQICRIPQAGLATCKSGGFIASGETGKDKMPLPFLPEGMKITANEGFGEVQTPVVLPQGFETGLGAPLFFRPAKSGEIAEHFTHYYLIRNHKIVDKIPTYRGLGLSFY